jgi:hypothetical protein
LVSEEDMIDKIKGLLMYCKRIAHNLVMCYCYVIYRMILL